MATDILQLIGLRSFKTAAVMLAGLLFYDVFWVFGSPKVRAALEIWILCFAMLALLLLFDVFQGCGSPKVRCRVPRYISIKFIHVGSRIPVQSCV